MAAEGRGPEGRLFPLFYMKSRGQFLPVPPPRCQLHAESHTVLESSLTFRFGFLEPQEEEYFSDPFCHVVLNPTHSIECGLLLYFCFRVSTTFHFLK